MRVKSITYFWYGYSPKWARRSAGAGVRNGWGQILSVAIKQQ